MECTVISLGWQGQVGCVIQVISVITGHLRPSRTCAQLATIALEDQSYQKLVLRELSLTPVATGTSPIVLSVLLVYFVMNMV
jgi:hypothetical protein